MLYRKFNPLVLCLLCLIIFGFSACRGLKDGMTKKERKAWEIARAKEVRDSLAQDSLMQIAMEQARLDSIRIADSIAALPPPINYDTVFLASILRTSCYGKCPHYEIRLYASGYAVYEGKEHTPRFGKFEARLDSAAVISALLAKIKDVDYRNFEMQYPSNSRGITDFPLTVTAFRENYEKKIVYNRNDAPAKLVEYEKFFDQLFEGVEWKPVRERATNSLVPNISTE
jgi:hypothetical protein